MTNTATVNYHVHKPFRQAFKLDAGGIEGNLISPELAETTVPLLDVRAGDVAPHFNDVSVGFTTAPSAVTSFADTGDWQATYDAELTDLLQAGEFARVHGEVFKDIDPVLTGVEAGLTQPGMMVEIDVDAIIHDADGNIAF